MIPAYCFGDEMYRRAPACALVKPFEQHLNTQYNYNSGASMAPAGIDQLAKPAEVCGPLGCHWRAGAAQIESSPSLPDEY